VIFHSHISHIFFWGGEVRYLALTFDEQWFQNKATFRNIFKALGASMIELSSKFGAARSTPLL